MSNGEGNVFERLFKLWATTCKLILDKKRDPHLVAEVLQAVDSRNDQMGWFGLVDRNRKPTMLRSGDFIFIRYADGLVSFERGLQRLNLPLENSNYCIHNGAGLINQDTAFAIARVIGASAGFSVRFLSTASSHFLFELS